MSRKFPGHPYDEAAPVIFMHIPKTSGTALTVGLRDAISPGCAISGIDRVLFGSFGAFETVAPALRSHIYVCPAELPVSGNFVTGHMALSTLWRRYGPANYLTVLREPLSRILSHWLYWRSITDDQLQPWGGWADYVRQARQPLITFLSCRDIACHVDNLSVRMLLWPHRLIPEDDFIDPCNDQVLMGQAIERLRRFSFMDIIENPRMPDNLRSWLGRPVAYPSINETTGTPLPLKRPLHAELTPETLDLMETHARLDIKLWTLLATSRIAGVDVEAFRRRALLRNATKYAWLMSA
jgi:hypothetical protein